MNFVNQNFGLWELVIENTIDFPLLKLRDFYLKKEFVRWSVEERVQHMN